VEDPRSRNAKEARLVWDRDTSGEWEVYGGNTKAIRKRPAMEKYTGAVFVTERVGDECTQTRRGDRRRQDKIVRSRAQVLKMKSEGGWGMDPVSSSSREEKIRKIQTEKPREARTQVGQRGGRENGGHAKSYREALEARAHNFIL